MKKNLHTPSVYGVGYIGEGEYNIREEGKALKVYILWKGMLERCYSKRYQSLYPTYIGCSVDEQWHNFQIFAQWFYDNYEEGFELDKDILIKGNKIYSSETCCFVPQEINYLFTKNNQNRGDLPIGVCRRGSRFISQMSKNKKKIRLGSFKTKEEAFQAYKEAKEDFIKVMAFMYFMREEISVDVYKAMNKYEVENND